MDMRLDEAMEAALRLVGNHVRCHHHAPGTGVLCTKVTRNGMVELEGMSGEFSPFLFELDGERTTIPVLGWVN